MGTFAAWPYQQPCGCRYSGARPPVPRVGFPLPTLWPLRSGHSLRLVPGDEQPLCRSPGRHPAQGGGQDGAAALPRAPCRLSLHACPPARQREPPWPSSSACSTTAYGKLKLAICDGKHCSAPAAAQQCSLPAQGRGQLGSAAPCLPTAPTPGSGDRPWKCLSRPPVPAGGAQTCCLTVPASLPNDLHLLWDASSLGESGSTKRHRPSAHGQWMGPSSPPQG